MHRSESDGSALIPIFNTPLLPFIDALYCTFDFIELSVALVLLRLLTTKEEEEENKLRDGDQPLDRRSSLTSWKKHSGGEGDR